MFRTAFLTFALSFLLSGDAANPAGKWSGVIEINDSTTGLIKTPVQLELAQHDGALTGNIGRRLDEDKVPISNGKVTGNDVIFEAASAETSGSMKFTLRLEGNTMRGEMRGKIEDGQIVAKVSFDRMKE